MTGNKIRIDWLELSLLALKWGQGVVAGGSESDTVCSFRYLIDLLVLVYVQGVIDFVHKVSGYKLVLNNTAGADDHQSKES